jgi:hypothetical protein
MNTVKPVCRGPFTPRIGIAINPTPRYHFVTFTPLGNHFQDEAWRILEIDIDDYNHLAGRHVQAGGDCRLFAKITAKINNS